jgi:hypothetical protein
LHTDKVPRSRTTAATADEIVAYHDLVSTARTDLEDQLSRINEKLDRIGDAFVATQEDADDVKKIKEERASTEQCLKICAKLADHITEIRQTEGYSRTDSADGGISSKSVTEDGLKKCEENLNQVIQQLQHREKMLFERLLDRTTTLITSDGEKEELLGLRGEWEAFRTGKDICLQAQSHLQDSVSTIENFGAGDAVQFMVSTTNKTIRGVNRGTGWRTRQVGGHIDPASFQQLMRSMEAMDSPITGEVPPSNLNVTSDQSSSESQEAHSWDQYGRGVNLGSR